jgi:hypothetical protein
MFNKNSYLCFSHKQYTMKFLKDIFSENAGGKYSSKKVWGHVFSALIAITYVMDGWDFYKIDHHLFDALLISAGYYLGLRTISKWFEGRSKNEKSAK